MLSAILHNVFFPTCHFFQIKSYRIFTYLLYQSSSFSLEHRASTTFSSDAVAEVSIAFKFSIETGLVVLCSNPQPGGPGLHIYIPRRLGGPVIPPGTGYPF
jgi:hypothetical protein